MANTAPLKQTLIVLALIAAGSVAFWLDYVKDEEPAETTPAAPAKPAPDLTRMTMAQAIAHCHALWLTGHYDQAPLAIAWHGARVDWYVLDGVDETSMRHFGCNGIEVAKGGRYQRVMGRHVPPPAPEPRNILGDRNLFSYYAALPDPGLRALEATEHPATRALLERRWPAAGDAQSDWPDSQDFPILFRQHPANVAIESYPALKPLTAINWLKEPARVFALLEKELPAEARIAELNFDDKSITLQIVGPIKNFEDKLPAPFGDASFDEYGIRDSSWWYPRPQMGSSCSPGHTVKDVAAQFAQSKNATHPQLWGASFSCRGSGKLTGSGSWTLRVPRRSR